ncbi:hypothetical protein SAMN02745830_07261 [Streptomyces sp. Amel2xC10]|nr:hypothetical protein SAMN02745830_07261 [Streptomyces sp. Amel2xC10]
MNSGWTGGFLNEEAYQWVRPVDLLTDEECTLPFAVGLDLNTAFLAAAARLVVGLSAPDHFVDPKFNPKIPGSRLVDLSPVELDPRLPSPFTPDGTRPTGPARYQTHTVAYAQELSCNVAALEAYLRRETGAYLDAWHDRLKNAYVDTLADLGVTKDLDDRSCRGASVRLAHDLSAPTARRGRGRRPAAAPRGPAGRNSRRPRAGIGPGIGGRLVPPTAEARLRHGKRGQIVQAYRARQGNRLGALGLVLNCRRAPDSPLPRRRRRPPAGSAARGAGTRRPGGGRGPGLPR